MPSKPAANTPKNHLAKSNRPSLVSLARGIRPSSANFGKRQAILAAIGLVLIAALVVVFVNAAGSRKKIDLSFSGNTGGAMQQGDGSIAFSASSHTNPPASLLEKYRNSNPIYNTQGNTPSAQLDLTKLLEPGYTDEWFAFNGAGRTDGQGGQFRASCTFSHLSNDDPIVYPGQQGAAHLHTYYGNTASNYASTSRSIIDTGGSTCDGFEANRTSYWFPTMMDRDGNARIPNNMILYYKNEGVDMPAGGYTAIPQGIKMLAGDSKVTTPIPHSYNDGWACGGGLFTNPTDDLIPNCSKPNSLSQKILFPRCWDGLPIDFTSNTYVPHVIYPSVYHGGTCPASHPKVFAEISILFEWKLAPGENTQGWYLSSDVNHSTGKILPGGTTRHGDYIAGWNKTVIDSWTKDCLNTQWNCKSDLLSNKPNSPVFVGAGKYAALKPTNFDLFAADKPVIYDVTP